MHFSLVIPLWNEARNIDQLVEMLRQAKFSEDGMKEVVLVNNGSQDYTGDLIDEWAQKHDWINPVHLAENLNYGGGVYEGFRHCQSEVVAYIPGDLQVHVDDLLKLWKEYQLQAGNFVEKPLLFIKGNRTIRMDGFETRFVSRVYTFLANQLLKIRVKDVNGLPKMFNKDLLQFLPDERMTTFVFDAQLLFAARKQRWSVSEVPVTFHARRVGVSSWSKKRFMTYWTVFKQILQIRKLDYSGGVKS